MPINPPSSTTNGSHRPANGHRMTASDRHKSMRAPRKPAKSNVTTRRTRNRSGSHTSAGDQSDDDEDDANASLDDDEADEPDALALPGTQSRRSSTHLAGRPKNIVRMRRKEQDATSMQSDDSDEGNDDDDDYGAVDNISDGDDSVVDSDEKAILRSAERDLIEEFERTERPRNATAVTNGMDQINLADGSAPASRRSLPIEQSEDELDIDLDFSEDPFKGLSTDDSIYLQMADAAEEAFDDDLLAQWRQPEPSFGLEDDVRSTTAQKKVRFEATPSQGSSVSSDDPRDSYPDLFDDIDDTIQRQQALNGDPDIDMFQDGESGFDFEDKYEKAAFDIDAASDSDSRRSDSDSEDDGDTTDEETVDEQLARMRQILHASGRSEDIVSTSGPNSPPSSRKQLSNGRRASGSGRVANGKPGRRPKSGTFVHDPSRATVSADATGTSVKLVCPSKPTEKERAYWDRARQAIGSRSGSHELVSWTRSMPRAASIPQRPFTAKSTLGTMFDGNLDFLRSNDVAGIADTILQPKSTGRTRTSFSSNILTEDEATAAENFINLEDFVKMNDSDSEMDDLSSPGVTSPTQDFIHELSRPSSPVLRRDSTCGGLLDHLDQQRGLVTSFRNNQHRAKHFSSLASHPAKRAQTSAQNALQQGRRGAANTPISPARKKWPSQDLDLTGAGVKKAGVGAVGSKRRSRGDSLSGIHQTLALDRFASER